MPHRHILGGLLAALLARGRARGREGVVRALLAAGIMLAPGIGRGTYVVLTSPNHAGTAVPILLTLLFQIGFGYSAVMAGLLQMPQAVAMMLMRFFVGGIIKQYGYRRVLLINTALSGILVMLFATFTFEPSSAPC